MLDNSLSQQYFSYNSHVQLRLYCVIFTLKGRCVHLRSPSYWSVKAT
jgi:hypothetical protein